MREKVFNTEIKNSLVALGWWAYKIPDLPMGKDNAKKGKKKFKPIRFNLPKPFDIIATIDGLSVAIEGKMIKKFQAFGMRDLRESQIENLEKQIKAGGQAFVFLNIRGMIDGRRENRCLYFKYEALKKDVTIRKSELLQYPYITGEKGLFDLAGFCREVSNPHDILNYPPSNQKSE